MVYEAEYYKRKGKELASPSTDKEQEDDPLFSKEEGSDADVVSGTLMENSDKEDSLQDITFETSDTHSSDLVPDPLIQRTKVTKICKTSELTTVNGMLPGPVVYANDGDRVIVKVTNETPQNATIHWHGVYQRLTCWADGPVYVTQCPILAGQTYTYEFTIVEQQGTLFWHAHVSWLRGTVHGAIVIYPKRGVPYPFPHPYEERILVFGEYFFTDPVQVEQAILFNGGAPPRADAYLINGQPGPRYNCSATGSFE
ncbi:uncharacterized protein A4U43_C10F10330 [Asparagus officinalis]|uniref:Plastocyanin-like domain-containing protein n=1 Tax=Asparagus officinalis TaxID=4686 RepID=A0A5P1E2B0_ASPOF|nr:uncharacterized protein A4U43_C10F10330 [Asparagus officinalis]